MISKSDLNFLARETGLEPKRATLLTEEPRDLQLLLETLSSRDFSKGELSVLSSQSYFRILTYKFSKDEKFSLEDKTFAADTICELFETIRKTKTCRRIHKTSSEKNAEKEGKYFFAAMCLRSDELKKFTRQNGPMSNYVNHIIDCFSLCGKREFARETEKWIKIFQKIKEEKWFQLDKKKKIV